MTQLTNDALTEPVDHHTQLKAALDRLAILVDEHRGWETGVGRLQIRTKKGGSIDIKFPTKPKEKK